MTRSKSARRSWLWSEEPSGPVKPDCFGGPPGSPKPPPPVRAQAARTGRLRGRFHKEPGGGLLADRLLAAADLDRELAGGGLHLAQLDLRSRHEPLVVEPVQELAVVLGEANDRGPLARLELGQRRQLRILGLLEGRVDG